jgi:hypothetical protein
MRFADGRAWSVQMGGDDALAAVPAEGEAADLPISDASIPGPLHPSPRVQRLLVSQRVRAVAAEPWAAWWRIAVAAEAAQYRETNLAPEPPLFGLPTLWTLDPPKFPHLRQCPN